MRVFGLGFARPVLDSNCGHANRPVQQGAGATCNATWDSPAISHVYRGASAVITGGTAGTATAGPAKATQSVRTTIFIKSLAFIAQVSDI